ncbi:MAG: hypothetical protein JO257_06275, partial [Deltaproteobacteria bacterium]|nr:hypothetical protein [Deltaproteobacteria bacterium]
QHGPHVSQLLLFGLLLWAFGTLLIRWGVPPAVAWLATLLWATHPICVQSVAWMSERKGILAALFVAATGHAWIRYRASQRIGWLVLAMVCAVCGVWSKAPAVFGPLAFAAWDLILLPRARSRWLAIVLVGGAAVAASVPVVVIASQMRVIDEEEGGAHVARLAAAVGSLGHYVQSMTLVQKPALSYPIQSDGPGALDLVLGVLALLGAAAAALVRRTAETYKLRLAALAWIGAWFLPISHLIAPVHILVADRYAFLFAFGVCLAIALAIEQLRGTLRLALAGGLVCLLAVRSVQEEQAWTNSIELFTRAFETNPRDPQMCENLASAIYAAGDANTALAILHAGVTARPREPHLLMKASQILWQTGEHDAALGTAQAAAESGLSSAAWRYAVLLELANHPQDAVWWARRAARYHPELEMYQRTYATILVELGRLDEAEWALRTAIASPDHPVLDDLRLADVLVRLHRYAEVPAVLDRARHDPLLSHQVKRIEAQLPH